MDPRPVLYLGDTNLDSAAAYLAGLLAGFRIDFDYVASDSAADASAVAAPRKLFILSDYPAAMMSVAAQTEVLRQVDAGAGLLMIGGWESFHGAGGDWHRSSLAQALPVVIATADDRVNCAQPALVTCAGAHPITDGLPWDACPPGIGGFNRFEARPGARVLLEVQRFAATRQGAAWDFTAQECAPLLVSGSYGAGRTVALATDVAPHWIGGWVDWGDKRFHGHHPGSTAIEVGEWYARFFHQLICWTGRLS